MHPPTEDKSSSSTPAPRACVIIPARFGSTRYPGKPLLRETGKYLIQHVYERAAHASTVARVLVATDDERIRDAVGSFGGEAVMTRSDHPSGTDRVAEVAAGLDNEVIVNVQGDEPELEPSCIDALVLRLSRDAACVMATCACPFSVMPDSDPADPHAVKVVIDRGGRALYFSRSRVPHLADPAAADACAAPYLHLGIYAYRRDFLLALARLAPTPLERMERLEQLRVLEHGYSMAVEIVERAVAGIDTPDDYAAFVRRNQAQTA